MSVAVDEIAPDIYRLSVDVAEADFNLPVLRARRAAASYCVVVRDRGLFQVLVSGVPTTGPTRPQMKSS